MTLEQFCLRWNNHQPNFISVFTTLLSDEVLVDVTLAAEGQHLQAHRVVLSACSSYFQSLFTVNPCQHPIVILKDVNFSDLKIMVDFMYSGEVNVSQEQLPAILKTAEMLKIKGLTEMPDNGGGASGAFRFSKSSSMSLDKADPVTSVDSRRSLSPAPSSPSGAAGRRKRLRKSSSGSGSGSTAGERTSGETLSEITIVPAVKSEVDPASPRPQHAPALRNATHDASTDSERRDGSQESVDEDMLSMHGSQDSSTGAGDGPVPVADTGPWPSTSQQDTSGQAVRASGKHRRLLTRQPRVKKESDPLHTTSPEREPQFPPSAPPCPHQPPLLVTVPPPICTQPHPSPPLSTRIPAHNLLSVPQPAYLVKQHSHPLLPSQKSSHASGGMVHRQLSTPTPGSSAHPPPLQVHFVATVQPREYALRVASPPLMRDLSETVRNSSGIRARGVDELRRASSSPQVPTSREEGFEPRSGHCPVLRPGPALGCNFCWNTIDAHGRILRRKTKYHCPECQTNLCIVPCFQEYHEKNSPGSSRDTTGTISPTVLKPLLPKTSSI